MSREQRTRGSLFLALRTALAGAALLLFSTACQSRETPTVAAGAFDYYVLSLSWSPEYCATTRRDNEPQCARPYAFVAHGLWPQNERGWPADCATRERVSDSTINRLLSIMPSKGLIIHEWRKHGSCSGLGADGYFETLERAYRSIQIPPRYQRLPETLTVDAQRLRSDLLVANPTLRPDGMVLQCAGRYLQEVRLCLDRSLSSRACGRDLRNRCGDQVVLRPVR